MRLPFDLIAAAICMGVIIQSTKFCNLLTGNAVPMFLAWLGFLLVVWLLNEWVTRKTEWRTRFGHRLLVQSGKLHPIEIHGWSICAVQAVSVALYAWILWCFQWPLYVRAWPVWLGLPTDYQLGGLPLNQSSLIELLFNLTPFLMAMLISWLPRQRFIAEIRGRRISFISFLGYEARLSWVPLILWLVSSLVEDLGHILKVPDSTWLKEPGIEFLMMLCLSVFTAVVALPNLVIWLWNCKPLNEGTLHNRLRELTLRSGVKVRGILVWGPSGTGLLNACVLGPWARFRYILISPQLVKELNLEETEAVMAHELGHVRYGHLTLLLLMMLFLFAILDPLSKLLPDDWRSTPWIETSVMAGFIVIYMWGFLGNIMRQCEREADLASAELLGTPEPLIASLEKLALIGGNIRNVYSWHHGSIAQRVAAVREMSHDPKKISRFHAHLRRVRIVFALISALALGSQFI